MIDEQSSASGHDYASDGSAIGAGYENMYVVSGVTNIQYSKHRSLLEEFL